MIDQLAVIFDVDGVLVDSYTAHLESWRALARERSCHEMSEDEFRITFGRTSREIIAELWTDRPLSSDQIRELDDRKEELFRDMMRADFRAMPGAAPLIDSLCEAGFVIAAGSSGPPDNVLLVLDQLGRRERFGAVVTGEDVRRGKPEPEVFERCASGLPSPPDDVPSSKTRRWESKRPTVPGCSVSAWPPRPGVWKSLMKQTASCIHLHN